MHRDHWIRPPRFNNGPHPATTEEKRNPRPLRRNATHPVGDLPVVLVFASGLCGITETTVVRHCRWTLGLPTVGPSLRRRACFISPPPTAGDVRHAQRAPQTDPGYLAVVGHRGGAGDFRRVFRLELRLGHRRYARLSGDHAAGRSDVHLFHLQLHRIDHRHSQCGRALRLQPARVRDLWRHAGRPGHVDRIRLRAAGYRDGDRRVSECAVPDPAWGTAHSDTRRRLSRWRSARI